MADIVRLKIAGFKSFVEPIEVDIEPGLTGIVGPNGCGKSNVVDALRWAMGETSAKQLRGGGMDDVIFAGASGRPSRNLAEVSIGLSDPDGAFPVPWIGQSELEIVRRIERGSGSSYRVNGREARARDVQTLFADLASGARSAAIVSQGQIGAFVVAKPEQRRAILEEAAGVAGLRARRHEATLRLNAAETNLERLEDVLIGFDNQLSGLAKQARQAKRFRKISDLVRQAEALAFIARWRMADADRIAAAEGARAAEGAVAEAARAAAAAERLATEATAALPTARRQQAEAAAAQQRLRIELERIEADRQRRADARAAARQRLEDAGRDEEREQERIAAAQGALQRLGEEATALEAQRSALADPTALDADIAAHADSAETAARAANVAADRAATLEAANMSAGQRLEDARQRAQRTAAAADQAEAALNEAERAAPDAAEAEAAHAEAEAAKAALDEAQIAVDAAREAAEAARKTTSGARDARAAAERAEAALAAEAKTLSSLLAKNDGTGHAPALDQVRADDGYETALGAALGDDLEAALEPDAPAFWAGAEAPATPLPGGAPALWTFVRAPAALQARLSQIGVVEDADAGAHAAKSLSMGQRLVSRAGDLWRWDGFVRRAGAETAAARKLALQNRLESLQNELRAATEAAEAARTAAKEAEATAGGAESAEQAARASVRQARQSLESAAAQAAKSERANAAHRAGLAAKTEAASLAGSQAEEAAAALAAAEAAAADVADPTEAKDAALSARAEANRAQLALSEARAERQRLEAAKDAAARRAADVAREQEERRRAIAAAETAIAALQARVAEAKAGIETADDGDARQEDDQARLRDALEMAEAKRRGLDDALVVAETQAAELARAAKDADQVAGAARERRVSAQARAEQATSAVQALAERIQDRLDAEPTALGEIAGVDPESVSDDQEALDRRVDRLKRERDGMGAVNLRAEAEIEEIETQSETIRRERDDLIAAIAKLRRGVADLAGEARQRLRAAFDKIDREFGHIFERLFGGGKARLALVGSDDPLEAGLEIMASPPGKSLQTLSLLSGGERALTAMALVLAAFRINPSPICVLDEIDAPLDDGNVDRICTLLEEIAAEGRTRFLVVTHHRMTMARMNRLYGVTMAERGVSQMVSVDFEDADAIREAV